MAQRVKKSEWLKINWVREHIQSLQNESLLQDPNFYSVSIFISMFLTKKKLSWKLQKNKKKKVVGYVPKTFQVTRCRRKSFANQAERDGRAATSGLFHHTVIQHPPNINLILPAEHTLHFFFFLLTVLIITSRHSRFVLLRVIWCPWIARFLSVYTSVFKQNTRNKTKN